VGGRSTTNATTSATPQRGGGALLQDEKISRSVDQISKDKIRRSEITVEKLDIIRSALERSDLVRSNIDSE